MAITAPPACLILTRPPARVRTSHRTNRILQGCSKARPYAIKAASKKRAPSAGGSGAASAACLRPPRPDIVLNAGLPRTPRGTVHIEHLEAAISQHSFDGPRLIGIFAGQDLEHDILDIPDRVARALEHFELKTFHVDLQ